MLREWTPLLPLLLRESVELVSASEKLAQWLSTLTQDSYPSRRGTATVLSSYAAPAAFRAHGAADVFSYPLSNLEG